MSRRRDRGIALIVVLFVSAILTLMMYAFLREMEVEYSLATSFAAEKQADQLAWSAIEKACAAVAADTTGWFGPGSLLYDSADDWYEIELLDPESHAVGVFSVIRPNGTGLGPPLFGLADEASKLNLNTVTRDQLMRLPRVTDEIADSIMDWRDPDDDVTGTGAENSYYQSLQPGYSCKNGVFDTVEELLLVRGMTPEILYGEDINQNGTLDAAEDDGDKNPPTWDDADGALMPGLLSCLTVYSRDRNVRADGTARVNINTANNQQLNEALSDVLDTQQINTIVGRRFLVAGATGGGPGYRSGADLMDVPGVPLPGIPPELYAQIADRVTTVDAQVVPGLVNVNTAPAAVLTLLADWTEEEAAAVVALRSQPGLDLSSLAWLVQAIPVEKVQSAAPFLTVRSWQFRIDAVARIGPRSRLEATDLATETDADDAVLPARVVRRLAAVYDHAASPARIVWFKDVSRLGLPYPFEEEAP